LELAGATPIPLPPQTTIANTTGNYTLVRSKASVCLLTALSSTVMTEYTLPYFLEYANRWGYPFYFYHSFKYVSSINNFKFKLRLIERYFDFCEWIAWFDSDMIFTNFTVPLESFIDTRYEFLASGPSRKGDTWNLNGGAMFIRGSQWSRDLFAKIYPLGMYDDQTGLQHFMNQPDYFAKAKMIPWKQLQQPYTNNNHTGSWAPGDFSVHFWGKDKPLVSKFVEEQKEFLNDEKYYPFKPFELGKYREYKPLPY
jgi:hypothetical protein